MQKNREVKSEVLRLSCVCLAAVILAAVVPALRAQSSIIEPGAKVQLLAAGFKFTEGPASDKDGNVYFTDQPNDRILVWSIDGKLSTFMEKSGRSNGLSFDHKGNLWACADEKNELWRIARSGKLTVVVKSYNGKLLNGPNDVWVRPDGRRLLHRPVLQARLLEPPEERTGRAVRLLF